MKTILYILLIIFFLFAGSYHFINPDFYLDQIPTYFSHYKMLINYVAGGVEIVLAIALAIKQTRRIAAIAIVNLLAAFIPTHWYVIQQNGCIPTAYCVPLYVAWLRLIILQPLLMWWAWAMRK